MCLNATDSASEAVSADEDEDEGDMDQDALAAREDWGRRQGRDPVRAVVEQPSDLGQVDPGGQGQHHHGE